jgi:hypothetical protein
MKIKANKVNGITPTIQGASLVLEVDLDEYNHDEIIRTIWELEGDDFIFQLLKSEGYDCVEIGGKQ